jgi:hypothetical protein
VKGLGRIGKRDGIWGYPEQCGDESLAVSDNFVVPWPFIVIATNRDTVHDKNHPEDLCAERDEGTVNVGGLAPLHSC